MSHMNKELQGAGPHPGLGRTEKKITNESVQVVGPESAEISGGKTDSLKGCCGASPLKMKGSK